MIPQLKSYTTFSLKKSINKPDELVKKCKEYGYKSLAITEKGNIYSFVKIFKKAKESGIKPIIGCDLYINDNGVLSNLTLLCKNKQGFQDLLKIIAKSNGYDNFNFSKEIATIKLEDVASLSTGSFIVYSGCLGSWLSSGIASNYHEFISASSYDEAKSKVSPEWKTNLDKSINRLQDIFGKSNVFLEYQNIETSTVPATDIMGKIIKDASSRLKIPIIATCKPHYIKPEDYEDQQIMICIDKKTTFKNIKDIIIQQQDTEYYSFFQNNSSYLLSPDEYTKLYDKEYLENNNLVDSLCEEYNILDNPKLPKFDCPNNLESIQYLKELCMKSWDTLVPVGEDSKYQGRLNYEMKVINDVGLAPYFLVLWDIMQYSRNLGCLSVARGSAGGCLISYLIGITNADPIKYNLVFERFYNSGRNQPGKVSFPDIDGDFEINFRKQIVAYIKDKYGRDKTGNIATFGSLKGAAALKEVLRMKNVCSADEANQISKFIIDEHKISDELEELRKEGEEATILGWSIENVKSLKQYVEYDDNGDLIGDYAQYFKQAIRLENCKKTLSKHAAGVVVSSEPLTNYCPLVRDKNSDDLMIGLEMGDVESVGGLKLDILGSAQLDDVSETIRLVKNGDLIRN